MFFLLCVVNIIVHRSFQVVHSFVRGNCRAHNIKLLYAIFVSHSMGCIVPNKRIFRSNVHKYHNSNVFMIFI